MRKSINVFYLAFALISIAILILSCFDCVEGVSYSSLPDSPTLIEPYVKTYSLFSLTSIPIVISILLLFLNNKALNVVVCVIVLLQSVVVTLAHKLYESIDALFNYIGRDPYEYELTNIGVTVSVFCWLLFLATLVLTIGRFSENKQTKIESKTTKIESKTTKIIITVLSIILALVSFPVLMIRVMIVVDVSVISGLLFFFITAALIFFAYYFPIKKTIKTNNKKYLWIMVAVIVIFLIQIIYIRTIWEDLFLTIGPGGLPSTRQVL